MSFMGDVYQHADMELGLTRRVMEVLIEHEQPFTILTKGGMRAVRDFDLLAGYPKARFGTTLVFMDPASSYVWEPGAASVDSRIDAINHAHELGIPTWVSLEPVIDPAQALQLVEEIHPIVDHWKVGKINHHPNQEKAVDWIAFRDEITALLDSVNADYYIKESLSKLKGEEG